MTHLVRVDPAEMRCGARTMLTIAHRIDRNAHRPRGQAVFEFTLIIPVLIGFILLAVDFGVWMYANVSIANAVREGARFAAVRCGTSTCGDGALIKQRVVTRSSDMVDAQSDVSVGWIDDDASNPYGLPGKPGRGDRYVVRVSHPHRLLFVPGAPPINIISCAAMRLEADDTSSTIVQDAVTC